MPHEPIASRTDWFASSSFSLELLTMSLATTFSLVCYPAFHVALHQVKVLLCFEIRKGDQKEDEKICQTWKRKYILLIQK